MKTTLKLNPASIGRFLKWTFLVLFISVLLYVVAGFIYLEHIDYDSIIYENNEQILTLFKENVSDFENMVKLLKETEVLDELCKRWLRDEESFIQPQGNNLSEPYVQLKNSGFVTKEQLEEIIGFFEKYGPEYVDVYCYGDAPAYLFDFFSKTHLLTMTYIDSTDEYEKELTIKRIYDFHDNDCEIIEAEGQWIVQIVKISKD